MKLELAQLYAVLGQWRWEASGAFWVVVVVQMVRGLIRANHIS